MKMKKVVNYEKSFLLLFLISFSLNAICQTTSPLNDEAVCPPIPMKAGAALPSTGMEQSPPGIKHVSMVAPDILCIEIEACRILPIIQIPYQEDPADVITIGKNF
jgi:hypothetical protein